MIKLGSNVKSKIHEDLTGHVVIYQPLNNYAVTINTNRPAQYVTTEALAQFE